MKKLLFLLAGLIFIESFLWNNLKPNPDTISARQLKKLLEKKDFTFINVHPPVRWWEIRCG